MARKVCNFTISEEDVEVLSAFVTKIAILERRGLEQLVGVESVNVRGIVCGCVGGGEGDLGEVRYVCQELPQITGMESSQGRLSPGVDIK